MRDLGVELGPGQPRARRPRRARAVRARPRRPRRPGPQGPSTTWIDTSTPRRPSADHRPVAPDAAAFADYPERRDAARPRPAASTCSSARRWPARQRPRPPRWRRRSTPRADPTAAAFFDVDNTIMQGACIFHLARGLHRRKFFTTRDILGAAWKQAYFRLVGRRGPRARRRRPRLGAGLHRRPHRQRARGARRGDLRRGHGAPDLARHPGAGPDAPRPGPAGVAGDRRARSRSPGSSPAGSG